MLSAKAQQHTLIQNKDKNTYAILRAFSFSVLFNMSTRVMATLRRVALPSNPWGALRQAVQVKGPPSGPGLAHAPS